MHTRGRASASLGPGAMAVAMLLFAIFMVETNMQSGQIGKILFTTVRMGTYAVYCGTLLPGLMAARQTADACDEPYPVAHSPAVNDSESGPADRHTHCAAAAMRRGKASQQR